MKSMVMTANNIFGRTTDQNAPVFYLKCLNKPQTEFNEDINSFYCCFNCVIPTPFPFKTQLN